MEDPIICNCMEIRKSEIEKVIRERKLTQVIGVMDASLAGTVCGGCIDDIQNILNQINK